MIAAKNGSLKTQIQDELGNLFQFKWNKARFGQTLGFSATFKCFCLARELIH